MSLIAGLKMEGIGKWEGLKLQGPLYATGLSDTVGFTVFVW